MLQIHQKIEQARLSAGLTQDEMAEKLGIKRSTYQYWEKKTPSYDKIRDVAKALNLPKDYFFGINDEKNSQGESKVEEQSADYGQPIIQVVLNLSYIGKKNADSIDKMADSNLLNAKSIATLVNLLASNSDLSALIDPSRTSQDMPDDLPVEAFLGKGGSEILKRQKQAGRKKVGHK